ncbi:MAG: hypothetical protein ACI87E_002956 [Mariniblastus sp.]
MSQTSSAEDESPESDLRSHDKRLFRWSASWRTKDWRTLVADSELPTDVCELISGVVKSSRLMRFEKSAVAADLVAHFQDGHDRGLSYHEIQKEFGDPTIAAALIRSSKLRNRPMKHKLMRWTGISAGALASGYVILLAYFNLGSPQPTIDYVKELQSSSPVFEDHQKAWPLYRAAWIKHGFGEGGRFDMTPLSVPIPQEELKGNEYSFQKNRWVQAGDDQWPAAVELINQHQDLLKAIREAAKLPTFGLEYQVDATKYSDEDFAALYPHLNSKSDWFEWSRDGWTEQIPKTMDDSIFQIQMVHVQVLRKATKLFRIDTRIAVQQLAPTRALENLEAVFGLAKQVGGEPFLVCNLVADSIAQIGFSQIEEILLSDPEFFSEDQLTTIQTAVGQLSIRDWLHLESERSTMLDFIQRMYTDDGNSDGRMTADGMQLMSWMSNNMMLPARKQTTLERVIYSKSKLSTPASLFLFGSRREVTDKGNAIITQMILDAQTPHWQRAGTVIEDFMNSDSLKHQPIREILQGVETVRNNVDRTISRQESVVAALAIHRYFIKNGEWPTSVNDVSPEFVNEFPIDQVNGALLNFKIENDQPIIYSVGGDRDDNGGVDHGFIDNFGNFSLQDRTVFHFGASSTLQGDWILWPQFQWKN